MTTTKFAPGQGAADVATMTLQHRIEQLVAQHGTLRAAARVLEMDAGYLSRLASGEKMRPGKTVLRRLGLRQIIGYELVP